RVPRHPLSWLSLLSPTVDSVPPDTQRPLCPTHVPLSYCPPRRLLSLIPLSHLSLLSHARCSASSPSVTLLSPVLLVCHPVPHLTSVTLVRPFQGGTSASRPQSPACRHSSDKESHIDADDEMRRRREWTEETSRGRMERDGTEDEMETDRRDESRRTTRADGGRDGREERE
ncbi:unnamed protein product, partial [Pleuronectes platessa]